MASGRITIDVGLETRQVAKGAKDAEKALKDLDDAVGDTARDGGRDLDKIEDELKDVQQQSKRTGRDIGRDMDDGFDRAKKGADEFRDEANSTAREAAASFDGSAESVADAFQEVSANALAGFGPAGAAAGLALAAGIGLGAAGFEALEEERAQLEERARDLASAYIEAGTTVLSALVTAERTADVLTDEEQSKRAKDLSKLLGGDLATAVKIVAGDTYALAEAQRYYNEIQGDGLVSTVALGKALDQEKQIRRDAAEIAAVQSQINYDLINSTEGVVKEVDELGNELYTLPDETQIMVDAKTGQASTNVENFKGDLDGLPEKVTATVVANVDDSALRNYRPPMLYVPWRMQSSPSGRQPL